jgi:hypothetical protein
MVNSEKKKPITKAEAHPSSSRRNLDFAAPGRAWRAKRLKEEGAVYGSGEAEKGEQ